MSPEVQGSGDTHSGGDFGPHGHHYAALARFGDIFDDLEHTRIANENRHRTLTQAGYGDTFEARLLAGIVEGIAKLEHEAELGLKKTLRAHPLGPWIKRTVGVGEKQGARLLAATGDPYWNAAAGRPRRGPAELWAYCGLHVLRVGDHSPRDTQLSAVADPGKTSDPGHGTFDAHTQSAGVAARRTKGQRANWSSLAKSRAYLVATSCIKQAHSPYREVYDKRKSNTEGKLHVAPCARCGPSGKPAQPGSTWSDGHRHADALRIVSKDILRDLWLESRAAHHSGIEDQ